MKRHSLLIDNTIRIKIVAIIAVEIGATDTDLVATATTVIAARILEIHVSFARNHTIVYRSIR